MAYTCYDPTRQGAETCLATSPDGLAWANASTGDATVEGRILHATVGQWDEAHETPELVANGAGYLLFYVGYKTQGLFTSNGTAQFGRATSTKLPTFTPDPGPVFALGASSAPDGWAMDSPSVLLGVLDGGAAAMLYTGYSTTYHTTLLLAQSADRGASWSRVGAALPDADLPSWCQGGAAEAAVRAGPDGRYYLFFQSAQEPHAIGVAVGPSTTGPWAVNPSPILTASAFGAWAATGPLAPHPLFENGRVRLWFHAIQPNVGSQIGYAEAAWPIAP
jgi:hypothetical protein